MTASVGHAAGDDVLRLAADSLKAGLRATDLVARIGGDEFVLVMPGASGAVATAVLERLRAGLGAAMKGRGWAVTASVGCVVFSTPPASVDLLLATADAAMYRAKLGGRDRVEVNDAASVPRASASPRGAAKRGTSPRDRAAS